MERKLYVAFLWHMHQPTYKLSENKTLLPWVRLHSVKDYYGLPALALKHPGIRMNFNFTPCLLEQILDYSENRITDLRFDLTKKKATELSSEDKMSLLKNFFMCNKDRMITIYPRYRQLYEKRGENVSIEALREKINFFSSQDWLDLQVWYNLTWVHGMILQKDEHIRNLMEKGTNFSEEEKNVLLERHLHWMGRVLDQLREGIQSESFELTTSPYHHPILPLLYDTNLAREADPFVTLPRHPFQWPDDAKFHLNMGRKLFTDLFGNPPQGLWPSEGSVAQEILPIVKQCGFNWIAADEEILAKTFGIHFFRNEKGISDYSELLYQPYRIALNKSESYINCIFRDHYISDRIGFVYSQWNSRDAVEDLMKKFEDIIAFFKQNRLKKRDPVIFIILDGENAWEYYPEGGIPFLNGLFEALSEHPRMETVTLTEYLEKFPPDARLNNIKPGSWINGNFNIWIGHDEKNKGWELLSEARQLIEKNSETQSQKQSLLKTLSPAEGSDWFWWYGDDHFSENELEFDQLFRHHLEKVYRELNLEVPRSLRQPIRNLQKSTCEIQMPTSFINPKIDGYLSSYFDWLGAGKVLEKKRYGAIHPSVHQHFQTLFMGFNLENFFIRLDPSETFLKNKPAAGEIRVELTTPDQNCNFSFPLKEIIKTGGEEAASKKSGPMAVFKEIVEIRIPFDKIEAKPGNRISFSVSLKLEGAWVERYPQNEDVIFTVPSKNFEDLNWSV